MFCFAVFILFYLRIFFSSSGCGKRKICVNHVLNQLFFFFFYFSLSYYYVNVVISRRYASTILRHTPAAIRYSLFMMTNREKRRGKSIAWLLLLYTITMINNPYMTQVYAMIRKKIHIQFSKIKKIYIYHINFISEVYIR